MNKSWKILFLIFLLPLISFGQFDLDSDGDGVIDDFDKDSDNDGILDINECRESNYHWSSIPEVNGQVATGTINGIGYTYTSNFDIVTSALYSASTFPVNFTIRPDNVIQNTFASNNKLVFDPPIKNPLLAFASIGRGGTSVPIKFQQSVEILYSNRITVISDTEVIGEEGFLIVRLNGLYSDIEFDYLADEYYVNFVFGADFPTYCDTDGDGIFDYLDLDSDNDGCLDAIEGGGNFIRTDIIQGGRLIGGVDSDGIPIIAGIDGQDIGTSLDETVTDVECIEDYGLSDTLHLCIGETVSITSNGMGSWLGTHPYTEVSSSRIDVTPLESTTYYYGDRITTVLSNNLFPNNDFEGGVAFTSDFTQNCAGGSLTDGELCVSSNPNVLNSNWSICTDYTTGNGNQLVINGDAVLNKKVICRTIPVENNTNYEVSTWLTAVSSDNPASLGFQINGIDIGGSFSPDATECNWTNLSEMWNSGQETSAEVCIVNKNTTVGGNDFAIDDITFSKATVMSGTADSTVVIVHDYPVVNLGVDAFICNNSPEVLNATNVNSTYLWNTTETSASIQTDQPGEYFVEVTSEYGCITNDTIVFTLGTSPSFDLGNDITLCDGEDTILYVPTDTLDIKWSTGSSDTSITINTSGIYKLTLRDGLGCPATDSMELTVNPMPNITLDPTAVLCYEQPLILDAGNPGFNYEWSTGASSQTLSVDQLGILTIRVFDNHGCEDNHSIRVSGDTILDPFSEKQLWFCSGDEITLEPDSGFTQFNVYWLDDPTSSTLTINSPGSYQSAVASNFCADTFTVEVEEISTDVTIHDLGGKSNYCFNLEGTELVLIGQDLNLMNIEWDIDRSNGESIVINTAGLYSATVSNAFCSFSLEIEILDHCPAHLYIPNAFTPNEDVLNDVFLPISNGYIRDYEMNIYDRWGMNIFTTKDLNIGWDGTFNNNAVQQDIYVYRITYWYNNEAGGVDEKLVLGTVALIK